MSSCSDDFPETGVYYNEISNDAGLIILIALGATMTLIMLVLFAEEMYYLHNNHHSEQRLHKATLLLGLYPVLGLTSLMALLVPTSTMLMDLVAACYVSLCIHTFVALVLEYFGGGTKIIDKLGDERIRLATPPCCCCCFCLPKNPLTKKSLMFLKLCALQVAVFRPLVLVIAAVLWTDGKYIQGETSASSAYIYITVLSGISTLVSMYGLIVIFRASRLHLRHQYLGLKFATLQLIIIFVNIQNLVFSLLARNDIPACIQSRGSKVRGSGLNHAIMIIEAFILTWFARFAYRRPDCDSEMTTLSSSQKSVQNGTLASDYGGQGSSGASNPVN